MTPSNPLTGLPPAEELLAAAEEAARLAGVRLRAEFDAPPGEGDVRSDAGRDLKLRADVESEALILKRLATALPALAPIAVLSEESGAQAGFDASGLHWVVDPLDGTLNFGRRLPLCCVSIGLWRGSTPVLGVVHDFVAGEMFTGIPGRGAFLNGRPIRPRPERDPARAVLATGFPVGRSFDDAPLLEFVRAVRAFKKVRLLGSAALSLAWLAAGRVDAYAEEDICLWDVAGGLAVVAAAGGGFVCAPGALPHQRRVVAHNGALELPAGFAGASGR